MPPPGDTRPARFDGRLRDLIWDSLYAPIARAVGCARRPAQRLQFLTIRRYLSFVFVALVAPARWCWRYGSDRATLSRARR